MILLEYKKQFINDLKDEYPLEEIHSFFNIIMAHYLKLSRLDLALNPEIKLASEDHKLFQKVLERLRNHDPIQYIIGETTFFGLHFQVNKNVLIPRPETEELVSWIIKDFSENKLQTSNILDIGTGSGCIAISLAKNFLKSRVTGLDISAEALKVAMINAEINKVSVKFKNEDILNLKVPLDNYDVIVSNPPYVRDLEKKEMNRNVLENEPSEALYVRDENPLVFYDKITKLAQQSLKTGGFLYFEINQYLAEETEKLMRDLGFRTTLKKDIFGNFRMIKGIKQ